jgi:hypothetical protein
MIEIGIKAIYSIVLLAVTTFCLREVYFVWFDRPLQIGTFVGTKDGSDAPSMADSFRRLVVQQQNVLLDLYNGSAPKQGEFRFSSGDVLSIHLADLARLPGTSLDSLKIEAAGVNVTSLLTTLRRWIVAPNEITGSVDQINQQVIVSASWDNPPHSRNASPAWQMLVLPTQPTLQAASFDLACRILFARIPPDQAFLKDVSENDFCSFSTALFRFRNYLAARSIAVTEDDTKAANNTLLSAEKIIDTLVASDTNLVFAYKLGGYIELERAASITNPDPKAIRPQLDKAQRLLGSYLERYAEQDPNAKDTDVQERLASLATRGGALQAQANLSQVTATNFLQSINPALKEVLSKSSQPGPTPHEFTLRPGASIGPAEGKSAGTLGCFVAKGDHKYLLSLAYVVGPVGGGVVSPAVIDIGPERQKIGTVAEIDDAFALVSLEPSLNVANGFAGIAETPQIGSVVTLTGRSNAMSRGKVMAVQVTLKIEGQPELSGLVATERISSPGDGGGPVVDDQNRLIGLLVASSPGQSMVLPIKPLLEKQGLTLVQ